ncbi:MAG: dTDP-4-dehydrorhamnose 3,5-epimerase family protein [Candidatus Thorarchaeota archaeon]|jgi:dTDP-4-dehydrorhamnose 3,5-epimerase
MKILEIPEIQDAFYVESPRHSDDRGHFEEIFHKEKACSELPSWGYSPWGQQVSMSCSRKNVVRGIHRTPYPKFVTCVSGSIYDVIVDLREDSPTYLNTFGTWLSGANVTVEKSIRVYIPAYCGHGFFSQDDDSILLYLQPQVWQPDQDKAYHWQSFEIDWPERPEYHLSDKDRDAPKYGDC